jgi:uncharacterized membrane protein
VHRNFPNALYKFSVIIIITIIIIIIIIIIMQSVLQQVRSPFQSEFPHLP